MWRCLILSFASMAMAQDWAQFVDPFIGTADSDQPSVWESNGGTYPGAATPNGMVQVTPDGYRYNRPELTHFSFLDHVSGYPHGSSGRFRLALLAPGARSPSTQAFSHRDEEAQPGFYRVGLPALGARVAVTVSPRCGLLQVRYDGNEEQRLLLSDMEILEVDGRELRGRSAGYHFYGTLDRPFHQIASTEGSLLQMAAGNRFTLRICFSKQSQQGARTNYDAEIAGRSFDAIRTDAYRLWNRLLGVVEVYGGTDAKRRTFYTALYHVFLAPHLQSDVDEPPLYSGLSPWDTVRSKHPLVSWLDPKRQADFVASLHAEVRRTGELPVGPMTGSHNINLVLDSAVKGIPGTGKLYPAMVRSLLDPPYGRPDMAAWHRHGYVPADRSYSVTKTVEYAYNAWGLYQFAKDFGVDRDLAPLRELSLSYQHLLDPEQGLLRARHLDGSWAAGGYREGNAWIYTFFVPHDVQGLINLLGGRESFVAQLERGFLDGHVVFDNEPALHLPHLFSYAGKADKTSYWVRRVADQYFSDTPGGLPGNDDLGSMSSWYVFAALGLFPVCPWS